MSSFSNEQIKNAVDLYFKYNLKIEKVRRECGIQQGLVRGIEQGKYKRALEAARRMLKYGDSVEKIADITQLSIEEIRQLQKSNHR